MIVQSLFSGLGGRCQPLYERSNWSCLDDMRHVMRGAQEVRAELGVHQAGAVGPDPQVAAPINLPNH